MDGLPERGTTCSQRQRKRPARSRDRTCRIVIQAGSVRPNAALPAVARHRRDDFGLWRARICPLIKATGPTADRRSPSLVSHAGMVDLVQFRAGTYPGLPGLSLGRSSSLWRVSPIARPRRWECDSAADAQAALRHTNSLCSRIALAMAFARPPGSGASPDRSSAERTC
jgi:hypothetical protein